MNPVRYFKKILRGRQFKSVHSDFILHENDSVQQKGELIEKEVFSGGPIHKFSIVGRLYLVTLLKVGITPESKVLDVGCGALRGGFWIINFLKPGGYCGIEPYKKMLDTGKRILFNPQTLAEKNPRFDHNSDFDFSVFDEKFDYIIARSIWTHTSKAQVVKMLDEFISNSTPQGVMLASYLKPYFESQDYKGKEWVGLSVDSEDAGIVFHSFSWIQEQCQKRNLSVRELTFDFYDQIWLYISK